MCGCKCGPVWIICACTYMSSSRWSGPDTRLQCVHAHRQTWLYMIKGLLKRNRASVGMKSRGRREDREWKTVWQKQANSAQRKRTQERLTDRRVRIIDRGSQCDAKTIDRSTGFVRGARWRERSEAGRKKPRLFVESCKTERLKDFVCPYNILLLLHWREISNLSSF